jgi:MFS family permease
MAPPQSSTTPITTDIPARLDRLDWSNFHLLVVVALGITWILDGLEVTIVGALGPTLQNPKTLGLTGAQIGGAASSYVIGAVVGALLFGWLTDRLGRKRMFFVTLAIYVVGVLLSAFSWSFWSFAAFRALTGFGIGGEYSAINSAIDELMPARLRGRIDLIINGSFWIGAAIGSGAVSIVLNGAYFPLDIGWRLGFGVGAALGLCILFLRRYVPESPRWLLTHGRHAEAEHTVAAIESRAGKPPPDGALDTMTFHPETHFGLAPVFHTLLRRHPKRSLLVFILMASQAFLYNAMFFTLGLILARFYHVPADRIGGYMLPIAAGNFFGPLLLGHFFDTIGRRAMIAGTYIVAGLLLAVVAWLFAAGYLDAGTQIAAWSLIFFFASAAASAAYLSAGELFPVEIRALVIAIFYAVGTGVGGVIGPWFFGHLIDTGSRWNLFTGYIVAAVLMGVAAIAEIVIGVDAERKSLEAIADPLSVRRQE